MPSNTVQKFDQLPDETNLTNGDELNAQDDEIPYIETESEVTEDSTRHSEHVKSKPEQYGFSQKKKKVETVKF